jgi:hypothetical protein
LEFAYQALFQHVRPIGWHGSRLDMLKQRSRAQHSAQFRILSVLRCALVDAFPVLNAEQAILNDFTFIQPPPGSHRHFAHLAHPIRCWNVVQNCQGIVRIIPFEVTKRYGLR